MKWHPLLVRLALNLYPPYLGAGVRITHISPDWHELRVEMRLRRYNRNIMGTQFGGSLYSMIDPHLMLLLMQLLGPEYTVWDKGAEIDFIRPGRGTVSSVISLSETELEDIRVNTADGRKYLPEFHLKIVDERGEIVAKVKKILYVRRSAA